MSDEALAEEACAGRGDLVELARAGHRARDQLSLMSRRAGAADVPPVLEPTVHAVHREPSRARPPVRAPSARAPAGSPPAAPSRSPARARISSWKWALHPAPDRWPARCRGLGWRRGRRRARPAGSRRPPMKLVGKHPGLEWPASSSGSRAPPRGGPSGSGQHLGALPQEENRISSLVRLSSRGSARSPRTPYAAGGQLRDGELPERTGSRGVSGSWRMVSLGWLGRDARPAPPVHERGDVAEGHRPLGDPEALVRHLPAGPEVELGALADRRGRRAARRGRAAPAPAPGRRRARPASPCDTRRWGAPCGSGTRPRARPRPGAPPRRATGPRSRPGAQS